MTTAIYDSSLREGAFEFRLSSRTKDTPCARSVCGRSGCSFVISILMEKYIPIIYLFLIVPQRLFADVIKEICNYDCCELFKAKQLQSKQLQLTWFKT